MHGMSKAKYSNRYRQEIDEEQMHDSSSFGRDVLENSS